MSIDNLLDLIIQYKEAAQLIETAQAEQETIKAQIKAEMAQRNTNDLHHREAFWKREDDPHADRG